MTEVARGELKLLSIIKLNLTKTAAKAECNA